MSFFKRRRLVGAFAIAAATAVLAVGGVAIANHRPGHVTLTGGGVLATKIQTDTDQVFTSSQSFVPLSGSEVTFSVPSGTTRLFNARFTAESQCNGGQFTSCSARVVGRNNSTGFVFELNPQSPSFAFASAGDTEEAEANAMERSRRVLTAGSYTFFVQWRAVGQVVFGLTDWHFAVDMHS
jgi:hypothetical protein